MEQTDLDTALSDEVIFAYLMSNPEFFITNKDILPRLRIPHESGAAVSLIEKQVSVLRGKCGHLENSLRDFIAVARENENLNQHLHHLIQELITAPTLESIVTLTCARLQENFNADDVRIVLIATPPKRKSRKKAGKPADDKTACAAAKNSAPESQRSTRRKSPAKTVAVSQAVEAERLHIVGYSDRRLKLFKELFQTGQTMCGMPTREQLNFIIGSDHAHVASVAMIPLHHERKLGVLALTSRDESRFGAGKGVMFLNQLGELLGRRIHSYGAIEKVSTR